MSTSWKKKVELEARNRRWDTLEFLRRVYWGATAVWVSASHRMPRRPRPREGAQSRGGGRSRTRAPPSYSPAPRPSPGACTFLM